MTTAADEKRDEAKACIKQAVKLLSEILIDETWGVEDYTQEYKMELEQAMVALLSASRRL